MFRATTTFTRSDGSTASVGDAALAFKPAPSSDVGGLGHLERLFERMRSNNLFDGQSSWEEWSSIASEMGSNAMEFSRRWRDDFPSMFEDLVEPRYMGPSSIGMTTEH